MIEDDNAEPIMHAQFADGWELKVPTTEHDAMD